MRGSVLLMSEAHGIGGTSTAPTECSAHGTLWRLQWSYHKPSNSSTCRIVWAEQIPFGQKQFNRVYSQGRPVQRHCKNKHGKSTGSTAHKADQRAPRANLIDTRHASHTLL